MNSIRVNSRPQIITPRIHSMRLPNFIRVLCFMICNFDLFTSYYFILSSLRLKLLGEDSWIFELK